MLLSTWSKRIFFNEVNHVSDITEVMNKKKRKCGVCHRARQCFIQNIIYLLNCNSHCGLPNLQSLTSTARLLLPHAESIYKRYFLFVDKFICLLCVCVCVSRFACKVLSQKDKVGLNFFYVSFHSSVIQWPNLAYILIEFNTFPRFDQLICFLLVDCKFEIWFISVLNRTAEQINIVAFLIYTFW